jgi:hypothetical protein
VCSQLGTILSQTCTLTGTAWPPGSITTTSACSSTSRTSRFLPDSSLRSRRLPPSAPGASRRSVAGFIRHPVRRTNRRQKDRIAVSQAFPKLAEHWSILWLNGDRTRRNPSERHEAPVGSNRFGRDVSRCLIFAQQVANAGQATL